MLVAMDGSKTIASQFLGLICPRLTEAAALAKAAEACANGDNDESAVRIAGEAEQQVYEAQTLLRAMTLMNRLSKE